MLKNILPPQVESPEEQKVRIMRDFFLGVIVTLGMNLIASGLFKLGILFNPSNILWLSWILNIATILIFIFIRRFNVVGGMMATYGLAFVVTLCANLFTGSANCFGLLS